MVVYLTSRFPLFDRLRVADAVARVRVLGVADKEFRDVLGEDGVAFELLTVELEVIEVLRGTLDSERVTVPLMRDPKLDDPLAYLGGEGAELITLLQHDPRFGAAIDTGLRVVDGEALEPIDHDDKGGYSSVGEVREMLERIAEEAKREEEELDVWEPKYEALRPRRLTELPPSTRRGLAEIAEAIRVAEQLSAEALGEVVDLDGPAEDEVARKRSRKSAD